MNKLVFIALALLLVVNAQTETSTVVCALDQMECGTDEGCKTDMQAYSSCSMKCNFDLDCEKKCNTATNTKAQGMITKYHKCEEDRKSKTATNGNILAFGSLIISSLLLLL